jgi:hypothetical protein
MIDTMLTPGAEAAIVEACTLLLAPECTNVNVRVEDEWSASPVVLVTAKVRLWHWPWFHADEAEVRLVKLLKLISRGRTFRVRVTPE